jgi:DNA replication protein DnaC
MSMTTVAAIETRLRQLKLSGMLESFAARCEAARATSQDPYDLLLYLLEDEAGRRDADALARRVQGARFEEVCDFRDFDWLFNPQLPQARLLDLARGRYLEEHASILLCGPTGVGKSFVAQALGLAAARQGRRVLFTKTNACLLDLAGGRADGSWPRRLRRYLTPELLILDDFAFTEKYTVAQSEDLFELVSRRYRKGSLIVTVQRQPQDLYPLFPSPVVAEALLDRLLNSSHLIVMLGKSFRPRQRPSGWDGAALGRATEGEVAISGDHAPGNMR